MIRSWLLGILAGAMVLAACSTPPSTQLVVVVASDYAPGDEIARIVVVTRDDAGATLAMRDLVVTAGGGSGSVTLPFSFGATPSGPPGRPLRIEVSAFQDGGVDPFVVRRAVAPFVAGQARRLVVYLERACEAVLCDDATTCIHGACASPDVPLESLDPVVPGTELAVDAAVIPTDAGAPRICAETPTCDGARHVEVGDGFACAVTRTTGRVLCWGTEAARGQLGNGATAASPSPVAVTGITDIRELALGDAFACASAESQLWCWGDNGLGQLGSGDEASVSTPVELAFTTSRLSSAAATVCATGGGTTCWGADIAGLALMPSDTCAGTPCARHPIEQPALDLLDWLADEGHTCVVRLGALACAGTNTFGEVGDGTHDARDGVVMIPELGNVWSVATTSRSTCAIDATLPPEADDAVPTVRCWGAGELGQLGLTPPDRCGEVPCAARPIAIAGLDHALEVAASGDTFCARTGDGAIFCWGADTDGALGDGVGAPDRCTTSAGASARCALAPTRVRGLDAIDLDARAGTFCAVRRDGGVSCWGRGYGELPRSIPMLP